MQKLKEWIAALFAIFLIFFLFSMVYVSVPGIGVVGIMVSVLDVVVAGLFVIYLVLKFGFGYQDKQPGRIDNLVLVGGIVTSLFVLLALIQLI